MAGELGRFSAAFFSDVLSRKRKQAIRVKKVRVTDCHDPCCAGVPGQVRKVELATTVGPFQLTVRTFQQTHSREALVWRFLSTAGELPVPEVFHVEFDQRLGDYGVVLEHIDAPGEGEGWDEARCRLAGAALADVHGRLWGKTDQLPKVFHLGEASPLTQAAEPVVRRFLDRMTGERHAALQEVVPEVFPLLAKVLRLGPGLLDRPSRLPEALIHGGFDETKVLFRRRGGRLEAVLIDWHRARVGNPIEDLAMFLSRATATTRAGCRETFVPAYLEAMHAAGLGAPPTVVNEELDRARVLLGATDLPNLCALYVKRRKDPSGQPWCKWFVETVPQRVGELTATLSRLARTEPQDGRA